MGNRSDVFDDTDLHTGSHNTAHCGFATGTRTLDTDFHFLHAQQLRFFCCIASDDLGGISGALAGALEAVLAAGGPADYIAVQIGNGDFGVIERGQHINNTSGDITTALGALLDILYCGFGSCFHCGSGILNLSIQFFSHDPENFLRYLTNLLVRLFPRMGFLLYAHLLHSVTNGLLRQTTCSFIADSTDSRALTFTGTGVGLGPLTVYRQVPAMTDAAVAVDLLKTTDVGHYLTAQITFHHDLVLKHDGDRCNVFVCKILGAEVRIDIEFGYNLLGYCRADAIKIAQCKFDFFIAGDVNPMIRGIISYSLH